MHARAHTNTHTYHRMLLGRGYTFHYNLTLVKRTHVTGHMRLSLRKWYLKQMEKLEAQIIVHIRRSLCIWFCKRTPEALIKLREKHNLISLFAVCLSLKRGREREREREREGWIIMLLGKGHTQLAFFINLQRAVSSPSATLTGRYQPAIDL